MFRGVLVLGVVFMVLGAFACSSSGGDEGLTESGGADAATRTVEAAGITVEATWLENQDQVKSDLSTYPMDRFVLIQVNLDTHSGDLGSIDMVKSAELRTEEGGRLKAEGWIPLSDDAHHRSGVVAFPRSGFSGPVELSLALGRQDVELSWERPPES